VVLPMPLPTLTMMFSFRELNLTKCKAYHHAQ
jgi:hypothetical protein